jgi:hypothetical protein
VQTWRERFGVKGLRRRRRKSSFAKPTPHRKWIAIGAACVAVIAGMWFFMRQAEKLAPQAHDIRLEMPLHN